MPEGPDGKTIIIVKKVSGHGGHHGGAWKVAFADFVTAMMALFMVLWLVNSASVTTRERIASYFREPGVFEKGSGTPLEEGGAGILSDAFSPPADANTRATHSQKIYKVEASQGRDPDAFDIASGEGIGKEEMRAGEQAELEQLKEKIELQISAAKSSIGEEAKLIGKIEIKVDQRGLHIEIMDTPTASMFQLGSSKISSLAEEELTKIAKILADLPNPVDIEGHTDARPYRTSAEDYDNWNLSADRANTARRILVKAGVKPKQVARVVGYADQRLKFPQNPLADGNRRISISMRYTELANKSLEGTKTQVTKPRAVAPTNPPAKPPEAATPATPPKTESAIPPTVPADAAKQAPESPGRGLSIEVGTHLPEGDPLPDTGEEDSSSWMEKDKIFGNRNPFFGQ